MATNAMMLDHRKATRIIMQNNRIKIYCAMIVICSIVNIPEDYKLDKGNLLNQWFVKLGWFWTNVLLLPVLFMTTKSEDKDAVSKTIFKILSSTTLWYFSVNFFQYVDNMTGFDISGHTFLLMFSNLLISSELKFIENNYYIKDGDKRDSSLRNEKFQLGPLKMSLFLLTLLWDFMLFETASFYHTIVQKVIAASWAIGCWYFLHINFYNNM